MYSDIELTKDAQKMVAILYNAYREQLELGVPKSTAKYFSADWVKVLFPEDCTSDTLDTFREVSTAFNLKKYIRGAFILSDSIIYYMENQFTDKWKDRLSFLAQFIP